jgi:hypothetical protein
MASSSSTPIDVAGFAASLARAAPPPGLEGALRALWHVAKGDWKKAHQIAQDRDDEAGAWVHAYLHRLEGDLANADYWYRQAGRKRPTASTEDEWRQIVGALLTARDADSAP